MSKRNNLFLLADMLESAKKIKAYTAEIEELINSQV